MKILFLPNWKVHQLETDDANIQAPDKQVAGHAYWFFQYFKQACTVDVIDFQQKNALSWLEKKANTYFWQGIKAFFTSHHYDVVISHGAQSGLMYSLLRTLVGKKQPLHIIFDIGAMNGARFNKIENAVIRFALKSNPSIICHSKSIIEHYKSTYTNLVSRARYIPFGVDTQYFDTQTSSRTADYVLSFGHAKRDYETLIKAWSGVDTKHKLRLIGFKGDAVLPNIEIINKVSISELKNQIANAKFVVIPLPVFNYSYGQMSFLQSMSMGKTVIVTNTPSSVDYLQDGKGSFFVKPYDLEDMRAKIKLLLNNKRLLAESDKKSRQYVLENFSEQQMAEQVERFILTKIHA
ncbi:MAG: glycosyltransferase family 4 protein [Pseudomonadota bacterium]